MVLQEEQHPTYGTPVAVGAGGVAVGVPSKKPTQRKTPQRGLGVAQLEKIRLEEQQQGSASSLYSSPPVVPLPPLPRSSPTHFSRESDPNPAPTGSSIPVPPAPFCDLFVPLPPAAADGSVVAPPAGFPGHGFLPLLWNPLEISPRHLEGSSKPFGFPDPLQGDCSNPMGLPPCSVQRRQQHRPKQSLPNASVNPSPPPSLSGVKLRMEPPSNQTNVNNSCWSPAWPEDEKMAGMKRPWPFPLDTMPDYTSFPCKLPLPIAEDFPPMNEHPFSEWKPGITNLRDGPCGSCTLQDDWRNSYLPRPQKRAKESSAPLHGDSHASELFPYHGGIGDAVLRFGGSSKNPDQLAFYSFLPVRPSNQETSLKEHGREGDEGLDLDLKL